MGYITIKEIQCMMLKFQPGICSMARKDILAQMGHAY